MKGRKFIKRIRTTAGRATRTLLCHLSLPTIDVEYDLLSLEGNPTRAMKKIRHFVERLLPKNLALQKDASFIIQTEVRSSGGGLRRKLLAKWQFGDELDLVFEKASQT